ncbi:Sec-independent protein translocase subunit TatB [Stackebrandtia soli]|uniref:Sec-independent protein translocase subunit TatB n=1 Tax=Stackebrandtia soli TaxID=1892856 RepID=UPI0039EA8029
MFENLGAAEIVVVLLIALFIIGPERLPKVLAEVGKGVRKLRRMASNATADISREVGTDINITDLHPKTFIRKHVLSEEDEAAIRNPLKSALDDLKNSTSGLRQDLDETASSLSDAARPHNGSPGIPDQPSGDDSDAAPATPRPRFDADAT